MKNAKFDIVRNLLESTTFINQKQLIGDKIGNHKDERIRFK